MRSAEEVAEVKALSSQGLNNCEIARRTGIPRGTIRHWVNGRVPKWPRLRRDGCPVCNHDLHDPSQLPHIDYAYLLGMYLGDGTLSRTARIGVYRLRICLDTRYPNIIAECARAMRAVMPRSIVNVHKRDRQNCVEVSSFSRAWPCLFPQHGPGRKHEREILLVSWQREITERHPKSLVRGLIHSDGWRGLNKSMGHVYVRYMFDNASADIRGIFSDACDQLGIAWQQPKERTISIARRESIAMLDTFVGPKT